MWMAGGGVRGGYVHGATDEFGFKAVENRVHIHDLHATILHLMGFDHEKLHLPLRRPRLPPDRRRRPRGPRADRVKSLTGAAKLLLSLSDTRRRGETRPPSQQKNDPRRGGRGRSYF